MIGQIQIRQQPTVMGMDSSRPSLTMHHEQPRVEMHSPRADLEIEQPNAIVNIDQHDALRAYHGGNTLEMKKQIYDNLPRLFLESLAQRVEQGNRLGQFQLPGNSIAEVYGGDWKRDPFIEFRAPAAYNNVHINVERRNPIITAQANAPQISIQTFKPEFEYHPGNLNIYVKQYASVEITPPEIDTVV